MSYIPRLWKKCKDPQASVHLSEREEVPLGKAVSPWWNKKFSCAPLISSRKLPSGCEIAVSLYPEARIQDLCYSLATHRDCLSSPVIWAGFLWRLLYSLLQSMQSIIFIDHYFANEGDRPPSPRRAFEITSPLRPLYALCVYKRVISVWFLTLMYSTFWPWS